MSWRIGQYIYEKLRSNEWGAKVVMQLSEYLRSQNPDLKGYSRRNIYNMMAFYEAYSSSEFISVQQRYGFDEIVQFQTAQLPKVLTLTTFTNHLTILANCQSSEERLFYILYSNRERLKNKELLRSIENNTYTSLLGSNKHIFHWV